MIKVSKAVRNVVLSYLRGVSSADAEIPVGLSDQQVRQFHSWGNGNNPHIKKINQNIKNKEKYPFKGLTDSQKHELLAWVIYEVQNSTNIPGHAPITESSEEVLEEADSGLFEKGKDLDKHLAKQLSRVPDAGLLESIKVDDQGKPEIDYKKKS